MRKRCRNCGEYKNLGHFDHVQVRSQTGHRGIYRTPNTEPLKWRAYRGKRCKQNYVGVYDTIQQAVKARMDALGDDIIYDYLPDCQECVKEIKRLRMSGYRAKEKNNMCHPMVNKFLYGR